MKKIFYILIAALFCTTIKSSGQFVSVGNGSYRTTFPGVDAAGRNAYPSGTPQISGNAAGKPVPTNDWWSSLIKSDHVSNLFNYPLAFRTTTAGLVVSYIVPGSGPGGSLQPMDDILPITVGVSSLNAIRCTVSDYSDWTVTMAWNDGNHDFFATSGIAMPFIYFSKKSSDVAQIKVTLGTVVVSGEMLIITNSKNGSDFAVYAPAGSTWTQSGTTYTSDLNGKDYWSMAFIPPSATNITTVANEYKKYAYVFPGNTTVNWDFNESTSVVTSTFRVTPDIKEGTDTTILMGLLPHQWGHLASSSPIPAGYGYPSIRGEIRTLESNIFSVENTFHGILPTLPYLDNYSDGFSPALMDEKISQLKNNGLATWTDSYNEGQAMNVLIQTARIADQTGDTEARDKIVATIRERLEDWLKAEAGEVAFVFYYNAAWSAMIGYPAGYGQDASLNDHHFHWGYFIHAASFVEQFNPGWASQWGDMIGLLVRDAASPNHNDTMFPFLRNFSPYAGHCWADGFANNPFGNNQESSSESMQFNSSLIHWGTITGNKDIRDLGIYLYTTEQTAIEEYWMDIHNRTFKPEYNFSMVSRIWGNGYDNQTFWTGDIEAVYGIEMYPMHGGSLYLGNDTVYVKKLWDEIKVNTGILTNEANPNLWHDLMWEYLAFIDPRAAINLYNSYPERSLKFGICDVQTYYWLHAMDALGRVNTSITADYPVSAVFTQNGKNIYVANNYSVNPLVVNFSDGYKLAVPAGKLATSKDVNVQAKLTSDFAQAYPMGSVNLTLTATGDTISRVEFFDGDTLIGALTEAPFKYKASNLRLGLHKIFAKVFSGDLFGITNILSIQVGNQVPYLGTPFEIPGTIEAGFFDKFEGGSGQGISYVDVSIVNEGGFRPTEYVDAGQGSAEGATVGWIAAGEWLEYTIDVKSAGIYNLNLRYSSGNSSGGGPFHIELDGKPISTVIPMASTGKWETWASKTISSLELPAGKHILRLVFDNGEFNLGKMTFVYSAPLSYNPPIANAATNIKVTLPETTGILDASLSSDPDADPLSYSWLQVYGPSLIHFSDTSVVSPEISNLEEGIYLVRLIVSDGTYNSFSEVLVIVTDKANLEPYISITSPTENYSVYEGKTISIAAVATDLDGTIALVEFYEGANILGQSSTLPYSFSWDGGSIGEHILTAKATDNGGAETTSLPIKVIITSPPSCEGGPANGDYTFRFTPDKNNPYLTFVPTAAGTGSPTCILYYSTSGGGPFPGYNVKPNVPYRITASEGVKVYFYYTYSFGGMQKNSSAAMHTYEIGSCTGSSPFLYIPVTSVNVTAGANSKATFTIDTNQDCTVVSDQSWLTVSAGLVNKFTTITVTAEANPTAVQRSAIVTVSSTTSGIKTVNVKQAAGSTGIEELNSGEILIFPVPVDDKLTIKGINGKSTAEIYDVCGNLILTKVLNKPENEIELSHLTKGVYFIKLQTDKKLTVKQIVKR